MYFLMSAASVQLLWGFLLVTVALQPQFSLGQVTSTSPADLAALIDFKAGLKSSNNTPLIHWDLYTDPCTGNGWPGVICHCSGLPSVVQPECNEAASQGTLRVRGINLRRISSSMQHMECTIHPALGSLTHLVYLDLSQNKLSGTIPQSLSNLLQLQWLQLADNHLTGSLPAFLGQLQKLQTVQLQNNRFNESVPSSWCSGNASYDVSGNTMLCGLLPRCFWGSERMVSTSETYLTTALGLGTSGGACDATPPDCDADVGCVIWTPKYWTNTSFIQFNFTGFVDYQSGIIKYEWGLGTEPYVTNVIPLTRVTSSKHLKDIKFLGSSKKMFVTVVYHTLPSIELVDGLAYYITVVAYNGAGPSLTTNSSSAAVVVDTTGPAPSVVYNTIEHRQDVTTYQLNHLQASWDDWSDPESGIAGYHVQFFQVTTGGNNTKEARNITDVIAVGLVNAVQMKSSMLKDGMVYYAKITGTNRAGLYASVLTLPITVKKAPLRAVMAGTVALIAVLCGVGCLAIGAGAQYAIMNIRIATEAQREKERQQEQKQLKQLMYALSAHTHTLGEQGVNTSITAATKSVDIHAKELAFVFTDIENSTEISNQDSAAFKQIQEAHDQVMRESIAKHHGYEVITEGDSFQVAFATCQAAIQFCLDVQYRLLEQSWSKEILKLHACRVQRATGDYQQIVFAGPRVRMGIHYAHPGTVAMRTHHITRQNVYGGPAVKVGSEVSDIAAGGQILLTEEAVMKLGESMSQAGFPVIKLCGQYKLETTSTPVFLYSCCEQVGKPLRRTFGDLRKAKKVWPNADIPVPAVLEYNIHVPPVPDAKTNALTFVCLRLTTYPKGGCSIPEHVQRRFLEVFAVQVQQFKGYMFQASPDSLREGIWTAAFSSCMDALRFTHAAQLLLMHTQWQPEARAFCGEALPGADGRWVFQGPRVCMAIHESSEYFVSEDSSPGARTMMIFAGPAVTLPLVLTYAGRGGQVILSETAWESVKSTLVHHPGAVRIISLGTHIVSDHFPQPMLLMEVMPNLLSKRVFQSLLTKQMMEPGYRDAPDPNKPMAVVFVKVSKPKEVEDAEKGTSSLADTDVKLLIQENQVALGVMGATVRKLLKLYEGYECKEPESGKFTLAFHKLEEAICWGCHFQEELLFVNWPATLLDRCTECKPQLDPTTGLPIWRGLRVKVGMSFGMVNSKKPLNTGRADYYGVLANGAARVMGLAAPGQVLVEAVESPEYAHPTSKQQELLLRPDQITRLPLKQHMSSSLALSGISPQQDAALKASVGQGEEGSTDGWECHIQADGYYMLRGLSSARLIYKAYSGRLGDRGVKITSQERLAPPPMGMYQSFVSSRDSVKAFGTWIHSFRAKHHNSRDSPNSSDGRLRISTALGIGCQQRSFAAGTAASVESDSPGVARSELSGVTSRINSSRLSVGVPRARSQEFGPGWSGGSATSAGHTHIGVFAETPEASLHSRRSRSWVTPGQRYQPATSSHHARSFTQQGQGNGTARMFGSGQGVHAAAGQFRQQQQQQQQADGSIKHALTPGSMSDLNWVPANLAPIHTRTSTPDADSRSEASGASVTSPPHCRSSPRCVPADTTTSIEHRQRMYLKCQAQRVVQKHSAASEGSMTPRHPEPAHPSMYICGNVPPPCALEAEQLRSHSQLLLEQQRSLQNMQQMVHDKESGDLSARSSWDGLKGYMTNIAGAVSQSKAGRSGLSFLLSRLSGSRTTRGVHEQEDIQAALARQQHGMQGNGIRGLPLTPGRDGTHNLNALSAVPSSPGTAFAVELGQAYVNHRRHSITNGQAYSVLYEARAASFNTGTSSVQHAGNSPACAVDGQPGSFVLSSASYSPQHVQQHAALNTAWHQPGVSQLQAASYSPVQAAAAEVAVRQVTPAVLLHTPDKEAAGVDHADVALELGSRATTPVPVPAPAMLANPYPPEEECDAGYRELVGEAASLHESVSCNLGETAAGWTAQQQHQWCASNQLDPQMQSQHTGMPQLLSYHAAADAEVGLYGPSGALRVRQAPAPLTAVGATARATAAASGVPFISQGESVSNSADNLVMHPTVQQEQPAAPEMMHDSALLVMPPEQRAEGDASTLQEQLQQPRPSGGMILTSREYGMYTRQQQQQCHQAQRQSLVVEGMLSGFESTAGAVGGEPEAALENAEQQYTWKPEAGPQPVITQQQLLSDPQAFKTFQQRLRHQQEQMTPHQLQLALQQLDLHQMQNDAKYQSQVSARSPLGIRSSRNRFGTAPSQQAVNRPGSTPSVRKPWQISSGCDSRLEGSHANATASAEAFSCNLQQGSQFEEGLQQLRIGSAVSAADGILLTSPRPVRADGSFASAGSFVIGCFNASPGDYSPCSSVGTPRSGCVTPRSVLSKSSLPGTWGSSVIGTAPGDLRHASFAAPASSPPGTPRCRDNSSTCTPGLAAVTGSVSLQAGARVKRCNSSAGQDSYPQQQQGRTEQQQCAPCEASGAASDEPSAGVYVGPPGMPIVQLQQSLVAASSPVGNRCRSLPGSALSLIAEAPAWEGRQSDANDDLQ